MQKSRCTRGVVCSDCDKYYEREYDFYSPLVLNSLANNSNKFHPVAYFQNTVVEGAVVSRPQELSLDVIEIDAFNTVLIDGLRRQPHVEAGTIPLKSAIKQIAMGDRVRVMIDGKFAYGIVCAIEGWSGEWSASECDRTIAGSLCLTSGQRRMRGDQDASLYADDVDGSYITVAFDDEFVDTFLETVVHHVVPGKSAWKRHSSQHISIF